MAPRWGSHSVPVLWVGELTTQEGDTAIRPNCKAQSLAIRQEGRNGG